MKSHSISGRSAGGSRAIHPIQGLLVGVIACAALSCDDGASPPLADASAPASSVDAAAGPHAAPEAGATPFAEAGSGATSHDAGSARSDASAPDARVSAEDATAPREDAAPDAHAPDAADAAPPAACSAGGLSAGDHMQTLSHQGRSRSYLVHVPKGSTGMKPLPVVIDLHGYSRTASSQKGASGWDALADREGILAVYPDGVSSSWNVGGCCGTAGSSNVDDVGFMRALVEKLSSQTCVDIRRVYASGVSNGAGMSARLGCDAADLFAGVALVSSDLRTTPCQPKRPVTEIAFRGTADTLEPYEGGLVGPPGMQYQSPGARGSFELWKNINRCTGAPVTTAKLCETYEQCAEGVEVTLCTLQGVGHSPYQNNLDFDIAATTWEAFQRVPVR